MRKQHIVAVSSEIFSFWLLTGKQQHIHLLLTNVHIKFMLILSPINRPKTLQYNQQLTFLSNIFDATVMSYKCFPCFLNHHVLSISLAQVQGFPLILKTYNGHFIIYSEPRSYFPHLEYVFYNPIR